MFSRIFIMSQSDSIMPVPKAEEKKVAAEDASDRSSQDVEKQGVARVPELKRKLKSRHLQMIAIGMLIQD
jgi:amino acid transporter